MRTLVRWGLQHGVIRVASRRAARAGDLQAQLMTEDRWRADPFPFYEQVRARGALVPGRLGRVTATYEVCEQVLKSEDFRAGIDREMLPGPAQRVAAWAQDDRSLGPIDPPSLLVVEPPDHTRYRRLVSKVFTARAVEGLRERTQAVADDLLDRLAGREPLDLVDAFCTQLPVAVISGILGVPERDYPTILAFGHAGAPSLDVGLSYRQFRSVDTAVRGFGVWLSQHLETLRREPGEDLLSQLVHIEDEGQRLTDPELRAIAGLLLAAGFETTVNLLGSGTVLLLANPEARAALADDPALWPTAVEEVLRLEGPVQMTGRFAVRPTEVAGQQIPRRGLVVTYLAGANRDPAVFADPHRFDLHRDNAARHLTFSAGRHFCLGAALARQEGVVGLRSLFERYPDLALDGPGRRRTTRVLRGWESLPVRVSAPVAVG